MKARWLLPILVVVLVFSVFISHPFQANAAGYRCSDSNGTLVGTCYAAADCGNACSAGSSCVASSCTVGGGPPAPVQGGGPPAPVQGGGPPVANGSSISIDLPNPLHLSSCKAGTSDLECLVSKIVNTLTLIAFPIATLMILWGAFQLMSSTGNPEKIEAGWKTIRYAVIGFAVILSASIVVALVQGVFSSVTS